MTSAESPTHANSHRGKAM